MRARSLVVFPVVLAALVFAANALAGTSSRYIVVFDDAVALPANAAAEHARAHGAEVLFVYRSALKGYAARIPDARVAKIRSDARVASVERDQRVAIFAQAVPTGIDRIFATGNSNIGIDGTDDVRTDVDIAVIDTGIAAHSDLDVVARTDCTGGGPLKQSCKDGGGDDGNGHGTHVAGTAAAIDDGIGVVGVAPGARLHAVKVLGNDGSGWMSWIVGGVDWVTARAGTIEVANMSLGCECSSAALDTAIARSVDAGVVYAVAAGNSNKNAASFTPANHPDVITVSALADFDGAPGGLGSPTCRADEDDTLANFSNWGATVNIAAPGVCILSTWKGGGYSTISGTSMASPHVAGAAGLLASGANDPKSKADVQAIRQTLVTKGNLDWTDDSGDGIKERLLDVGDGSVFAPATVSGSAQGGGSGGGGGGGGETSGFTLSAKGYKVRGLQKADLTWSGSEPGGNVVVYRNGSAIATTADDGSYTDNIDVKASGTYTYTLCEEGTTSCSNEAVVSF